MYCACHARRSSAWQLCVLRLPRERQPRPNGDHARRKALRSSAGQLCVLRLPRERQPHCTWHEKGNLLTTEL